MEELIEFNNEKTHTSIYLTEQINLFRGMEGDNAELQHYDLLKKIKKEFSEEISEGNISVSTYQGTRREEKCYELKYEYALQLLMSESKTVRKGVVKVLKELTKPKSVIEILETALVELKEKGVKLLEARKTIEKDKPKVDFVDKLCKEEYTTNFRDTAKVYGVMESKFIRVLEERGFIYRTKKPTCIKNKGTNIRFYANDLNTKLFALVPWGEGTVTGNQTKLTASGVEYFRKVIYKWIDESDNLQTALEL